MSSGAQVGGILGAAVGAVVGFYTGNWQAVQWGYAIGSAVGGYVDPTKTSGPRLTDAQAQTSTVGGIIPHGYGFFTCAGNIIWSDELKEHKKTQRVGKGGSQKNTTYTYTRSYAVGVAQTITSYVWIKKNGKLVYAADPAGLGAAMGWNAKQISDLAKASSKFLQMATLYYGTSTQMPDSTIVAVEGVGNVSPFRDLAYTVLENEDLTDMQGAVSQYEFCVFTGAAKSYTTPPYPTHWVDGIPVNQTLNAGGMAKWTVEPMDIGLSPVGGELRNIVVPYKYGPEDIGVTSMIPVGGEIRTVRLQYTMQPESLEVVGMTPEGGLIKNVVLHYNNYEQEPLNVVGMTPLGGALS